MEETRVKERKVTRPVMIGMIGGIIGGFIAVDIASEGELHRRVFSGCKSGYGELRSKLGSSAEIVKEAASDIGDTVANAATDISEID